MLVKLRLDKLITRNEKMLRFEIREMLRFKITRQQM